MVVLPMIWERKLSEWTMKAMKQKDKVSQKIYEECNRQFKNNRPFVVKFLQLYLTQCCLKHQIAFFQWREMMVANANHTDLDDAIESKINFMKRVNPKLKEKKTKFAKPDPDSLSPSKQKT